MGNLGQMLSQYWTKIQGSLFPLLEETLDPLMEKQQQLVAILELVRIEQYIPDYFGCEGRPLKGRKAIARAYVAKMVYNSPTTRDLWERLHTDKNLRRICGWETMYQIPSEATFSKAFDEFAQTGLPQRVHEALIEKSYAETGTIVLHISRDSTAVKAREKPVAKQAPVQETKSQKKRGRPKKGEEKAPSEPKMPSRTQLQRGMTFEDMLKDLSKDCNIGAKKNSKGHAEYWIGYKLHLDMADGGIPISAILTSASVHDSQPCGKLL